MGKLSVFNFITLNGFYKGLNGDISWHQHGEEESKFSELGIDSGNTLVFGRVTYEMMAGFWPTPVAYESFPKVAEGMNKASKIVFSRTIKNADWENTLVIADNMLEEIGRLKLIPGKDMTILGSGSIVTQLAVAGLIDEYIFMLDPIAIQSGTPIFNHIGSNLPLKLLKAVTFNSGAVVLTYTNV